MKQNALSNARHKGESFANYKARLRAVNKQIRVYLRGKFCHVSSQIVGVPLPMEDAHKKDVERGLIRDLTAPQIQKDGKLIRIGRTKGVTFRHPDDRDLVRVKALHARREAWARRPGAAA